MSNKTPKVEQFIKAEKKEYTIKLKTLGYIILLVGVFIGGSITGWMQRSEFANEVKSEVRTQMSAVEKTADISVKN